MKKKVGHKVFIRHAHTFINVQIKNVMKNGKLIVENLEILHCPYCGKKR